MTADFVTDEGGTRTPQRIRFVWDSAFSVNPATITFVWTVKPWKT